MVENIVIIGGGIIGTCIAYYLSRDERVAKGLIKVTIIEANELASGASGKAGGFLTSDWHRSSTSSLAKLSYTLHEQLAEEYDGEKTYGYRKLATLQTHVVRPGKSHTDTFVNPFLEERENALGPYPTSIDSEDTLWFRGPNIERVDIIAGIEGNTTAQIHPLLFTRTIFEQALTRGVQYIKGRPTSWNEDSQILKVDTENGPREIPADCVVIAAGPWSGRVTEQLLNLDIPVLDRPGHSILIRPTEPLPAQALFTGVFAPGATEAPILFVRPDGHVYVSGENTGAELPEGTKDVTVDPEAIEKLVKACAVISTALAEGTVEVGQLCYRPMTPHGSPYVGFIKDETTKALIATGHGPWGITLAPGTGKVMAELILSGHTHNAVISDLEPLFHISFTREWITQQACLHEIRAYTQQAQ